MVEIKEDTPVVSQIDWGEVRHTIIGRIWYFSPYGFFSPPLKSNDAGLGIAEHPTYCRPRTKCGEAVHIHQPPLSSHPQFMPSFPTRGNSANPFGKLLSAIRLRKFIYTICRRANFRTEHRGYMEAEDLIAPESILSCATEKTFHPRRRVLSHARSEL